MDNFQRAGSDQRKDTKTTCLTVILLDCLCQSWPVCLVEGYEDGSVRTLVTAHAHLRHMQNAISSRFRHVPYLEPFFYGLPNMMINLDNLTKEVMLHQLHTTVHGIKF